MAYRIKLFCVVLAGIFLISGCGKKKDDINIDLNLPETEMQQLSSKTKGSAKKPRAAKAPYASEMDKDRKFYIYADKGYFKNHYIPSGWMGDHGDVKFIDGWQGNPYSRKSCVKIVYTAEKKQGAGWAGIYWQDPANNWGSQDGGYNLTGRKKLTFFAKGEKGGELITEFKMGGIQGEYSDSTSVSIGPIALTPEWKQYEINLEGEDLSRVIGGFCFVVSEMENPEGMTFYLDEVLYE